MTELNIVSTLGGFGLFLFCLRFLSNILECSLSYRIKPLLSNLFNNRWSTLSIGFGATTLIQASSISIISVMGLLNASLISLEQGFFLMLGATLGTTIKAWFFAEAIHKYGLLIIGVCSLSLIVTRKPILRTLLEIGFVIGVAFLALDIVSQGLAPFLRNPQMKGFLVLPENQSFLPQLHLLLISTLITMLLQSSSATIFLLLELALQNALDFPAGVICILGANIGTTITALFASIEYSKDVKRLALSHLLIKLIGASLALLFFPSFISFIDSIVWNQESFNLPLHLAATHTIFNFCNMLLWIALSSPFLRFLKKIIPEKEEEENLTGLPRSVRRMLVGNPQQALKEMNKQIQRLESMLKGAIDHCLVLLTEDNPQQSRPETSIFLTRRFQTYKEVIYELVIRLHKKDSSPALKEKLEYQVVLLREYSNLHQSCINLKAHLEESIFTQGYYFPKEIQKSLHQFQEDFNKIYLNFLLGSQPDGKISPSDLLKPVEKAYKKMLREEVCPKQLYWLDEVVRYLEQMIQCFDKAYEQKKKNFFGELFLEENN